MKLTSNQIKIGIILALFFVQVLGCYSQISTRLNNLRYNSTTHKIEFELQFKAMGTYEPGCMADDCPGNFIGADIRWDFVLENGLSIDLLNSTAVKSGLLNIPNNPIIPEAVPGGTAGLKLGTAIERTRSSNASLDLNTSEYITVATYSIAVVGGDLTSSTLNKIVQRTSTGITGSRWSSFEGSLRPFTPDAAEYPIAIASSCPETSSWKTTAADNNWNNASNWSNGVPGTCTAVTIKAGASFYPILTSATGAKCNTIHFEHGAEVAGTHFLTYSSASVDMTIPNSRWHMVAPPLRNMYSGDYWLSESTARRNPSVSMMKYQAINPQYTSIPVQAGEWSNTFNTLDVLLKPGIGYATCINLNDLGINKNYTFSFPKTATAYDYYDRATGEVAGSVTGLSRTNGSKFIYEGVTGWSAASADGSFNLPVENGSTTTYEWVLISNPYMSHLDMTKLYLANTSKLTGAFTLWTGDNGSGNGTNDVYSFNGTNVVSTSNAPLLLAPMQSIWAKRNGTTSFNDLTVNAAMSVTAAGQTLRSDNRSNELVVDVLRAGNRQSSVLIRYREEATNGYKEQEDAQTFFIANLDNKPAMIYAEVDKKALSVNTLSDWTKEVALVISTSEKGWLTLQASGMESFTATGADWYLLDKWAGKKIRLSENASYSFENTTGNLEGRFALKVENAMTGLDNISNNTIGIHANAEIIHITSAENLKTVEVYNLQGQLLAKQTGLNTTTTSLTINQKGAVIVKVTTSTGQRVEKIRMD